MILKIQYDLAGGHVHCRLFIAKQPNQTWQNCGEFAVTAGEQFEAIRSAMTGVEFEERTRDGR